MRRLLDTHAGRCGWRRLFLMVTALHVAVSFPLSFYSGYVLEHRFQLSTLSLAGWLWRYAKRSLLARGLRTGHDQGLYWLIWTTGPLVVAGGGRGLFPGQRGAGATWPRC